MGLPLHVPLLVVSVWPWVVVPLIAGSALFVGAARGGAWTAAVCDDVAGVEPPALVAVTTTRMVSPTSLLVRA